MNIVYENHNVLIHKDYNKGFDCNVVLFKNYNRPDESLDIILNICNNSKVIYDMLLNNCVSDRFYVLEIKDNKVISSNKISFESWENIIIRNKKYIMDNLYLLDNSVLSIVQKFLIKRGKLI